MPTPTRRIVILLTAMAVIIGGLVGVSAAASDHGGGHSTFAVDVAENGLEFIFDEAPVYDDGMPAGGNSFVTQGYIYPDGTLTGEDGVNADGSPEFPDLVIGTWTCYGYMINDAAYATEGAWVVSSQIFEFHDDAEILGGQTIITQGVEAPPASEPALRAVTGGTGRFTLARGEVTQNATGFNQTMGIVADFDFDLRGVRQ